MFVFSGQAATVTNVTIHGVNAIYVTLDRFVSASPVRLLHLWHSMVYGTVYAIFSAIHFGAGGPAIYPLLNYYEAPAKAVMFLLILALFAAPLAHFLMYLLTVLRDVVWERCQARNRRDSGEEPTAYPGERSEREEPTAYPGERGELEEPTAFLGERSQIKEPTAYLGERNELEEPTSI
jgi:hypothetical protein